MAVTSTGEITNTMIKKIDFFWTALTTGTTSGSSTNYYDGEIVRVVATNTLMAAGTIRLLDDDSNDLLMGAGTLTTGTSYFTPTTGEAIGLGGITNSQITFEHTVYPTTGTGHCYVYIR